MCWMFPLEDIQTRQNERTFVPFYLFHAEGSLIISWDANDTIFYLFFNY